MPCKYITLQKPRLSHSELLGKGEGGLVFFSTLVVPALSASFHADEERDQHGGEPLGTGWARRTGMVEVDGKETVKRSQIKKLEKRTASGQVELAALIGSSAVDPVPG